MTTVAAVVVIVGDEPHEKCLDSLRHLDAVCVLTDQPRVLASIRQFGARGQLITKPTCIETLGKELLSATTAEWLLLIDPDERLICTDPAELRLILGDTSSEVAGYWLSYQFRFLGHPLHRTYSGLRKPKLVRPGQVNWPSQIHSIPIPISAHHRLLDLPKSIAFIETELLGDVAGRLARHTQWALTEAKATSGQAVDTKRIAEAISNSLQEYFSQRFCEADGTPGLLNGLLHLNKTIAALLFEAAIHGIADDDTEGVRLLGDFFRRTALVLKGKEQVP